MGVLASHVPSIEQLKPGLIEIIEEAGGSKQFFRTSVSSIIGSQSCTRRQCLEDLSRETYLSWSGCVAAAMIVDEY
jgi:F-type H+-transporting ATPase subunit delta